MMHPVRIILLAVAASVTLAGHAVHAGSAVPKPGGVPLPAPPQSDPWKPYKPNLVMPPSGPQLRAAQPAPTFGRVPPPPGLPTIPEDVAAGIEAGASFGDAAEVASDGVERSIKGVRQGGREAIKKPGVISKESGHKIAEYGKEADKFFRKVPQPVLDGAEKILKPLDWANKAIKTNETISDLCSGEEDRIARRVDQIITDVGSLCAQFLGTLKGGPAAGFAAGEALERFRNSAGKKKLDDFLASETFARGMVDAHSGPGTFDRILEAEEAAHRAKINDLQQKLRQERLEAEAERERELRSLRERASLPPEIDPGPSAWETLAPALLGTALQLGTSTSGSRSSGSSGSGQAPATENDAERTQKPCVRACECGRSRGPGAAVC